MSAEDVMRCQLCGTPVRVVSSGEGTSSYQPVSTEYAKLFAAEARLARLERIEEAARAVTLHSQREMTAHVFMPLSPPPRKGQRDDPRRTPRARGCGHAGAVAVLDGFGGRRCPDR